LPLGVHLTEKNWLEGMPPPDRPELPAAEALRPLQQVAGAALPQDSAELFAALLAMEQDELVRLLAVCVAATVDVVTPRATVQQPGAELAQAVGLNMAAWWKPTAEGYFKHVSKEMILEAVGEFAPSHVTRLAKLKKNDIASEAERLADGSGWMPAVFRSGHDTEPQEGTQDVDAPEDSNDEAEAHALAAEPLPSPSAPALFGRVGRPGAFLMNSQNPTTRPRMAATYAPGTVCGYRPLAVGRLSPPERYTPHQRPSVAAFGVVDHRNQKLTAAPTYRARGCLPKCHEGRFIDAYAQLSFRSFHVTPQARGPKLQRGITALAPGVLPLYMAQRLSRNIIALTFHGAIDREQFRYQTRHTRIVVFDRGWSLI